MKVKRYRFEVIDTNGCCEFVTEMLASDVEAAFDKVTEISHASAKPGYRIRVRDQDGNVVFVGVTTRQGSKSQDNRAA